jgi:uncharacterized protein YcaQ
LKKYFLTNSQARQFLFLKHGLLGEHKFIGKQGALEFVKQAGCIQFDPVDICGKNAEILLQARVKGFDKKILDELLYEDRLLFDYPDKQLSIIPTEDWHFFSRFREWAKLNKMRSEEFIALEKEAIAYIEKKGAVSSSEIPIEGNINWFSSIHWSGSDKAARAVLEQLYSTGELVIHHKKGTRKYYDLAAKHILQEILNAPEPLPDEFEHIKWRVLRRIGAVGFLWNKKSDAFLNIAGLTNEIRNKIFEIAIESGEIISILIEGIKNDFFCLSSDEPILEELINSPTPPKPRMELIAPLDCLMWDRKLIQAIFGFSYRWEIYTPENKRKHGAYTLPLIYGENFIGRVDISRDTKSSTLFVKNIWFEEKIRNTKKLQNEVSKTFKRFAKFNNCRNISVSRN